MMNLVKVRVDITDQFSLTEVEIETEFGNIIFGDKTYKCYPFLKKYLVMEVLGPSF